ncbi:phage regulatory CII family protein [Desulfolutivibrio sulfoxidireducens]|uniref:phage regulatory CII family protein n=1 Tax=Desulfolutivibrio sulfoxidireducens TaxID=2773299 RepID=UPI00159EB4E4|nr:phage regulatory CII family protein [Desulfolutivibrio sulfoxidireducens]QLA19049.1 hypothetical protein GD604_04515 [Desulfolutivibrio sulfoxidireducens]
MPDSIMDVLREMVRASGKPAKALARELGKPYTTFMRELSQADTGAKLGVELLLPLMRACDSILPLRFLASRMDCRVVSLRNVTPDKPTLHEELLDSYEALTQYHRAMRDRQPPENVAALRETVIRQVQEDFVAYIQEATE